MFLSKNQKMDRLRAISDCFNDFIEDLNNKKTLHSNKNRSNNIIGFKNQVYESPTNKTNIHNFDNDINFKNIRDNKYEGKCLDKIIHHQNFDKKYSEIMNNLYSSPKHKTIESPRTKKNLLWDFKITKDGTVNKDQSLKRLENLKFKNIYKNDAELPEDEKIYNNFLNMKNTNFKQSSSSDFFKSTANTENKTLYSPRNSFYNVNSENKLENLSFYSYRSFSSAGVCNNNNNLKTRKSIIHSKNFKHLNGDVNNYNNFGLDFKERGNKERAKKVNFDYFNTIGKNPFTIDIYQSNDRINSAKRNVAMKNSYLNISPKNFYPVKNEVFHNSNNNKKFIDYSDLFENTNQKIIRIDRDLKSNINLKNENMTKSLNIKNRIFTANSNTRQSSFKRIDNLIKNFSNKQSFLDNKERNKQCF